MTLQRPYLLCFSYVLRRNTDDEDIFITSCSCQQSSVTTNCNTPAQNSTEQSREDEISKEEPVVPISIPELDTLFSPLNNPNYLLLLFNVGRNRIAEITCSWPLSVRTQVWFEYSKILTVMSADTDARWDPVWVCRDVKEGHHRLEKRKITKFHSSV